MIMMSEGKPSESKPARKLLIPSFLTPSGIRLRRRGRGVRGG